MTSLQVGHGFAFLTVLLSLSAAAIGQNQSETQSSVPGSAIHVTQVLGFASAKHNDGKSLSKSVTVLNSD